MNNLQNIALRIRSGDVQAFEQVFRDYYAGMCGYATKYLDDIDQSEEVVQAVFITYWNKRTVLDITGSVEAYLYRAVRNSCLNQLKHLKVRQQYAEVHANILKEEQSRIPDKVVELELQQKIEQSIEALPLERRKIFKLSREEGLKYQEIADQLGLSIKTVEAQMGKALKYLRENLVEYLPFLLMMIGLGAGFCEWGQKIL